jgi:hypothetical protein
MAITFEFQKIESTASPLYVAKAIDENDNTLMTWHIACENEEQLGSVAKEAYELSQVRTVY